MNQILNVNTTKIDLSNQNLTKIPEEIFEFKNLKKLILRNNKIKVIPQEIEKLKKLETLELSGNNINNFYSKVCTLKKLKILNLNNNKIKTIPIQIKQLTNLLSLHFANNSIFELPKEVFYLEKLRELDISNNNIEKLNSNIMTLQNLRKLWINNLPISKFPKVGYFPKSLICLYTFSTSDNSDNIHPHYKILSKIKGNSLKYLNFSESLTNTKNEVNTNMENKIKRNKIFISYSHNDKAWLEKLQQHLKVLTNHFQIDLEIWDDNKLQTGDVWKEKIITSLKEAGIAIFLVSTNFLASEFINKEEIPPILENAEKNGTLILSIILKPCMFEVSKLKNYQALNTPSHPFSKMNENEIEEYFVKLTKQIHDIFNKENSL